LEVDFLVLVYYIYIYIYIYNLFLQRKCKGIKWKSSFSFGEGKLITRKLAGSIYRGISRLSWGPFSGEKSWDDAKIRSLRLCQKLKMVFSKPLFGYTQHHITYFYRSFTFYLAPSFFILFFFLSYQLF
jgi:hypothetical protein